MKKIIYILGLLLIVTAGCKKSFFDINTNPNAPTEESITSQLILPRALQATASRMATSYDYAAHWMGYWARSGSYGPSAEQESYNLTTSFQADEFGSSTSSTGWYDILTDVNLMETKSVAAGEPFYTATAKVIKSIGFMYLVDQYNNVPYSQAFDFQNHILPGYDKGADIYADLLVQLDAAAKLLATAPVTAEMKTADIMFKGNTTMWRKLINTQRLKLLIHQSQVISAATVAAEIAKINADGSGYLGTTETASVNPGYVVAANKQNPYWATYKLTELGAVVDNYNRANNYILDKFMDNNDIRYKYVFSAAVTPLSGNTYYGYNFGEEIPNDAPKAINSSDVAGPGLAKSATQNQWVFTSVESLFIQAEAVQRGWISGAPETAYYNAVKESFVWLGVTQDSLDTQGKFVKVLTAKEVAVNYLVKDRAPEILTSIVDWNKSTNKIGLIDMQKYLALIGINNFEAYVDYRRLGIPADLPLSLYSGRGSNKIPLRILYPQDEYNYNAVNVGAEGVINAQTSRIFWDIN